MRHSGYAAAPATLCVWGCFELTARLLARGAAAKATFEALAFTHRREYARLAAAAKRSENHERRVTQTLEMLYDGRTLR